MNPFKVSAVTLIALVQYWVACRCGNNRPLGLITALMQTAKTLLHQALENGVVI
jgi:hypothetical protein